MLAPKISIVVAAFNMARELPRTLFTLRAPYQHYLSNDEIEIIVVDNGSTLKAKIKLEWNNVRQINIEDPTHSPVKAINLGLAHAKAELVCVMVDGARMASPGMLINAYLASKLSPRAVISTMAYHLGSEVQMKSVLNGYNKQVEDQLLKTIPWREDGYTLYEISVFAGSSRTGWFNPIAETNALFMNSDLWAELGGYDSNFQTPGGGLANLDTYLRATELENSLLISLMGEGTFHQVHGGVATNQQREDATWSIFHDEYISLRGKSFSKTNRETLLLGSINKHHKKVVIESLTQL